MPFSERMFPLRLLILHLVCQGVSAQWSRTPNICSDASECIAFVSVCRDSEYDTRAFEPSGWVGTQVIPTEPMYKAKRRLVEYFNKKNRPVIQIERTAPILTMYRNINGVPRATAVYSYLPRRFISSPPVPRDELVYLTSSPSRLMFVRSAGPFLFNLKRKSQDMFEDLLRQREAFLQDRFYIAEYTSPLRLFGRRNEIWYQAQGMARCTGLYRRGSTL